MGCRFSACAFALPLLKHPKFPPFKSLRRWREPGAVSHTVFAQGAEDNNAAYGKTDHGG